MGPIISETSAPLWHPSKTCISPTTNQQSTGGTASLDRRQHIPSLFSLAPPRAWLLTLGGTEECLGLGFAPSYLGQEETCLAASPKLPAAVFFSELFPTWAAGAALMLKAGPFRRGGVLLATRQPTPRGPCTLWQPGAQPVALNQHLYLLQGSQQVMR